MTGLNPSTLATLFSLQTSRQCECARIDRYSPVLIGFDRAKGTAVVIDVPEHVAAAHVQTIRDLTESGSAVDAGEKTRGRFRELMGYTTGMADPLQRIIGGERPFNTCLLYTSPSPRD